MITVAKAARRQQEIPGTEPKRNDELEKDLGPYLVAKYQLKELTGEVARLKALVDFKMEHDKITHYVYRDGEFKYEVERSETTGTSIKSKRTKIADDDDSGE